VTQVDACRCVDVGSVTEHAAGGPTRCGGASVSDGVSSVENACDPRTARQQREEEELRSVAHPQGLAHALAARSAS